VEIQALSNILRHPNRIHDDLRDCRYSPSRDCTGNRYLRSHAGIGHRDLRVLRVCEPPLPGSFPFGDLFCSICSAERDVRSPLCYTVHRLTPSQLYQHIERVGILFVDCLPNVSNTSCLSYAFANLDDVSVQ